MPVCVRRSEDTPRGRRTIAWLIRRASKGARFELESAPTERGAHTGADTRTLVCPHDLGSTAPLELRVDVDRVGKRLINFNNYLKRADMPAFQGDPAFFGGRVKLEPTDFWAHGLAGYAQFLSPTMTSAQERWLLEDAFSRAAAKI